MGLEIESQTGGGARRLRARRPRAQVRRYRAAARRSSRIHRLCRMDVNYSAIGTEVEVGKIDGQQNETGPVVRFPFYDPRRPKPRSWTSARLCGYHRCNAIGELFDISTQEESARPERFFRNKSSNKCVRQDKPRLYLR